MSVNTRLQGIYAISDEILTPYEILSQCVESALKAGVRIFQLRDKSHSDEWLCPIAKELLKLCERYNALFVLNDRLDLALRLNAPALHIGRDDGEFSRVRERFSGILGASSYGDLQRAKVLESLGADYVAFGAFFPSPTKPNAAAAPLELLIQAKQTLKIPICAIGGISTQNIHLLKNADMNAVINSLWANNSQDSSTLESTHTNSTHTESSHIESTLQNRLDSITHNAKALQQCCK
ncbi:thiamine phosphate synthase [Helicobacter cinaedi]|uniref:thiamine phosphate synthase n=1 Tax=Helicobacter cinaedi TaxID=213 RepID=UPI000CF06311|nr:thiamine phosphate synthase [Helicobacter cinaedi]AWK61750.1 thiamine phosphate synthase [Helicobacter cinaedi]QOQ95847.1 thiamine phosphate synthase [Helicobacter cinaedi]